MEKELAGKGFLRSHASYLVNPAFIKSVKKLDIQMLNGEILPISQPKRKGFMEKLTEYWGGTVYDCAFRWTVFYSGMGVRICILPNLVFFSSPSQKQDYENIGCYSI